MATEAQNLWIPCEAFDAEIILNDAEGPTPLEQSALLFFVSPTATYEGFVRFLGLGSRVALDLITQLWLRGYLTVDAMDGTITLEEGWRPLAIEGSWTKFFAARQQRKTISLVRDLVAGQVLPDVARESPPRVDNAAPVLIEGSLFESVDEHQLALAAVRGPELTLDVRKRLSRAAVKFAQPGAVIEQKTIKWLNLRFLVTVDGILDLKHVPTDDRILDSVAPTIGRRLAEWANQNQDLFLQVR
jgi:hypothetical protein